MPSAVNLTPDSRFMALFVGPKHSGKTVAACSLISEQAKASKKRIKNLDFDGRIRGILGAPWIDKSIVDYEFYQPKRQGTDKSFFMKLNDDLDLIQTQCNMGQNPYETLIGDSLTAACFGLLCDAIPLTHIEKSASGKESKKGKYLGQLAMAGPEDYGFEATGTYQFLACLRSLPIPNIIVTAHVIDKYGKLNPDDKYSESVIVGEKLSIRDKIGANIGIYFDHIFRFDRRMVGGQERFFVKFRSDIACTSYPNLPTGEVDITGINFYEYLMKQVKGEPMLALASRYEEWK